MASTSSRFLAVALVMAAVLLSGAHTCHATRRLDELPLPQVPGVPKLPMPEVPKLPVPPVPEVPTVPQLPGVPGVPLPSAAVP